jgi:hypothetical protein
MKKGNPAVGVVIAVILGIMLLFMAYTIYCVVYKASRDSDFAYLGDYTTYINEEDNLAPEYSKGDLITVRRETYYSTSQVIVYKSAGSYRMGKVVMTSTSKYYVGDSMSAKGDDLKEITYDEIVGSANKNLGGIGAVFTFLTSPIAMVITAVLFLLYIAFSKEK